MTVASYLEGIAAPLETEVKTSLGGFLATFITNDIGKVAADAVAYAATLPEGTSGAEKRETAKTQLLNDAEAAGKDLSGMADSFLNFLIEAALQAVTAGAVAAAI